MHTPFGVTQNASVGVTVQSAKHVAFVDTKSILQVAPPVPPFEHVTLQYAKSGLGEGEGEGDDDGDGEGEGDGVELQGAVMVLSIVVTIPLKPSTLPRRDTSASSVIPESLMMVPMNEELSPRVTPIVETQKTSQKEALDESVTCDVGTVVMFPPTLKIKVPDPSSIKPDESINRFIPIQ